MGGQMGERTISATTVRGTGEHSADLVILLKKITGSFRIRETRNQGQVSGWKNTTEDGYFTSFGFIA